MTNFFSLAILMYRNLLNYALNCVVIFIIIDAAMFQYQRKVKETYSDMQAWLFDRIALQQ